VSIFVLAKVPDIEFVDWRVMVPLDDSGASFREKAEENWVSVSLIIDRFLLDVLGLGSAKLFTIA